MPRGRVTSKPSDGDFPDTIDAQRFSRVNENFRERPTRYVNGTWNAMRRRRVAASIEITHSRVYTMKLEKSSGFVDDIGSCYERCETRCSRSNGSAIERDSLSTLTGKKSPCGVITFSRQRGRRKR